MIEKPKIQNPNSICTKLQTPTPPSYDQSTGKSNINSPKNTSKSFHDTNIFVDGYQQQQFHDFYNSYIEVLENINISKPELVKRSFEQYMSIVEDKYIETMNDKVCDKINKFTNDTIQSIVPKEYMNSKCEIGSTLGTEFYVFFRILDLHWKKQDVKKKDILLLSPCKIFLLQSIIKRKYNDDLDFK